MERWENKIAVVTGASSGIGAAIVVDLVKAGLITIGLARRQERVAALKEQLPKDKCDNLYALYCDVSSRDSVDKAFDWIIEKFGAIDVLVNNAGCMFKGQLCDMNVERIEHVMQTNVMGVVYATQRAFKSMKERQFPGHVILINSIVGHKVLQSTANMPPEFNMYAPTKFALTAMTEVYRQEFKGLGTRVKITSISPGAVDTEIVPDNVKQVLGDCMLESRDISECVLFALSTPAHVQIHEMIVKPVGEAF